MTSLMFRPFMGVMLGALLGGCSSVRSIVPWGAPAAPPHASAESAQEEILREREEARTRLPGSPRLVPPSRPGSAKIRNAALADRRTRIVVSTAHRTLWLMQGPDVVIKAPVAVGMHEGFTYGGKTYDFKTPHSQRRVIAKGVAPIWVPPDWHYLEKAVQDNLKPVQLTKGQVVELADGTRIEVRDQEVGRVNQYGNFWPFTPGSEIIFEGKIYIPPVGSNQRRVPYVLGTHKLEIGDGYLIHGTNEETTIGEAVSHGCVRMYNEDVDRLYSLVPVGTPVYIF